ncbi:DUF982 domain-containing protein [Mesorhizobium sp. M2C.T.Ca.TU.002.02.1.1]|uniref:DUF982 domain-containing protein n=1 Tax=Mesorhizobium sp. M2C.T.Ca.TU.002.02.1.1 TaxID=2496788 RepID=UPI000FCC2C59|nr:DUF982 domain-containing protein [Mesorhizobium sp. M2C.T.Ca.TU.002.02.1.1]RUU53914.1 DUF982 domain-containing protein [Mesorhizobium sp. M2C.T.Ca.TU.002.02.1.1]RUU71583.1 DUF982 domain-containing protein [Mesorhizobium sp. M2C.T.Ca.TU.009.01.2.1]
MALNWFHPPVPVKTDQPGLTYNCANVEGAAEELLKWSKRGPHWNRAVRACMACLADQATPQEVRRLFRLAAKEEGVLREMVD